MRRIRTWFLTGIAVTLPTVVTVWILWQIVGFLNRNLGPLVERWFGAPNRLIEFATPILGLVTLFVILVLAGFFAGNFLGRKFLRFVESLIYRVPIAGRIYLSIKQIMDVFVIQKLEAFQTVVIFQYPRKGLWAMGFISRETPPEFIQTEGERFFNVFVPTSPNPTSGFVLLVPESELRQSTLSVEEALKLIVSGGAYVPNQMPPDDGPLLDENRREDRA